MDLSALPSASLLVAFIGVWLACVDCCVVFSLVSFLAP